MNRQLRSAADGGIAPVFLGVLGLGAFVTLHFPEHLRSADLRTQYPMSFLHSLIEFAINMAFLADCLSMLLHRRKVLGPTGGLLAIPVRELAMHVTRFPKVSCRNFCIRFAAAENAFCVTAPFSTWFPSLNFRICRTSAK